MSALLVFKKGSYLKLIPYFSKLVDIKKKVYMKIKVPYTFASNEIEREIDLEAEQTLKRMQLFCNKTVELLDKTQTEDILGDQQLLQFEFVTKKQETVDMLENAFICVTRNQISAISNECQEVGRITGL